MRYYQSISIILIFSVSGLSQTNSLEDSITPTTMGTSIIILGTIQDGGSPHIGCTKECCSTLFDNPDKDRQVVSLGLYDSENNKRYLFDASPGSAKANESLEKLWASK